MRSRAFLAASVLAVVLATSLPGADADLPFPGVGGDLYDYTRLHITNGSCAVGPGERVPPGSDLPANFDCREDWKHSDYAAVPGETDYDPLVQPNPQELLGVRGMGTNRAWEVTTGRPDTLIAVMDSGIRWDEDRTTLVDKFFLNRGELPVPNGTAKGGPLKAYDLNHDGVFNVADYATDVRVVDDPGDQNTLIDPGDLVRVFSDTVDDDHDGYTDDISGWDFFENDNDPNDDVDYGHGTGESEDSAGETGINLDPQCPNCMLVEMRVGDSFVADVNHFAEAAVYAVDHGVSVIQSALGTLNNTGFAQAAADYAYSKGVLFVASAADESAGHHNFPSALNHTMVVNSVTHVDLEGIEAHPNTWLAFNGCTNFGGYIWVSVESSSCSSDAVAQTAGIAGLLYSAARNAVEQGLIAPGPAGRPLSAAEAKQLVRLSADDIDFSTPKPPFGPPNNFASGVPGTQRFVTTAGWDQISGWGRLNANDLVRMVAAGQIPPEADITSPRWWEPLPATGTVDVVGRVAAPRAGSYTYEVQVAPGVQPPRWPLGDTWTTVGSGSGTAAKQGVLASLDLATVRSMIDAAPPVYTAADDPTAPTLPERDAFRVRVVVHADGDTTTFWKTSIEQHQAFAVDDPTLHAGFPRFLNGDGASSPAFDDIDGDGVDELVIGDGNGLVHAYKNDGREARGWPVHTAALALPTHGDNAYARGEMSPVVYAPLLLGSPAVGDLDGDGSPEVAVGDIEGNLWVWDATGRVRSGFPVRGNPAFVEEPGCQEGGAPDCDDTAPNDTRDELNTVDQAFTGMPSIGDLDRAHRGLELVEGSNDGHVYAWHADGTPVAGWPVLLRDPAKVAAVDPVTHLVTYTEDSAVHFGRKVLASPTLGDLDGDGELEVVANVNEEYEETPNWSQRDPDLDVLAAVNPPGNTRVYALYHDGTEHPATPEQLATPHPDDQAYVTGWPVPIGMVVLELLPYVGEGSNGAPVLADVDGDGHPEIATASIAGPPYVLRADGSSLYGSDADGLYITAASAQAEFKSSATDGPSIASLGGPVFGRLTGAGTPLSVFMGSTGLKRLLDVVLPEQQIGAEDHLGGWDATTGTFAAGFPAAMNDLQFFNTPAVADVTGDGLADVLQGSAMYDLRAYGAGGVAAPGFPKATGGWIVQTPAVGDLDGDGLLDVAIATRDGNLFVWDTAGDACGAGAAEWPKYQHDLRNTGDYGTDARRPSRPGHVVARPQGRDLLVRFDVAGDDGVCGTASSYRLLFTNHVVTVDGSDAVDGVVEVLVPGAANHKVWVQAVDDAGNAGYRTKAVRV